MHVLRGACIFRIPHIVRLNCLIHCEIFNESYQKPASCTKSDKIFAPDTLFVIVADRNLLGLSICICSSFS